MTGSVQCLVVKIAIQTVEFHRNLNPYLKKKYKSFVHQTIATV